MDTSTGIRLITQLCIFTQLATMSDGQYERNQAPHCYNTLTCPCCKPGTCPSDGSGHCDGNCKDGYYGGRCWNRCPFKCVRCIDADSWYGSKCTQCKEGYYTTSTEYQCQLSCPSDCSTCDSSTHCTSCRNGYYLSYSKHCNECHDTCLVCNSATSCSSCKDGYYLEKDEEKCYKCSPRCSTCTSYDICTCSNGCVRNLCNHGECTFGCKTNFSHVHDGSWKCNACTDGLYGDNCNMTCSENCQSACDRTSGTCAACKHGFLGGYCDIECPEAFNCRTCDASADCTSCNEGYYMTTSNRCVKCNDTCVTCDSATVCRSCKAGYYLDQDQGKCYKCSPICSMCTSNDNCTCSNGCFRCSTYNFVDYCSIGCKRNFTDGPIGRCFSCMDGLFGYNCNESCSEYCVDNCDRISGTCDKCKPGFRGRYCDKCKEGYYGNYCTLVCRENCKECRMTDGLCEICVDGFHGDFCEENCSEHCLISRCNKADGGCVCSADYNGDICQNPVRVKYSRHIGSYIGTAAGVVLATTGLIAAGFRIYRRRKRTLQGVNSPMFNTGVIEKDEGNLEQAIAKLDGRVSTFKKRTDKMMGQLAELKTKLEELRVQNTDRAQNANEENSYEMLQLPDSDASSHYSTLKP